MEASNRSKPAQATWCLLDSQKQPTPVQILSKTQNTTPLSPGDISLVEANQEETKLKHPAPFIDAGYLEEMFEGQQVSDKKIFSLFQQQTSDVNQAIWVNLFTTVSGSQISKKQALFLINTLTEFVRNHNDSNIQSKDFHRLQKKSILIGYTILSILQLQSQKDEGYLSPNEKYFCELQEKEITRESIKIGCYISKIIEHSEIVREQVNNEYKSENLFTKFLEGLVGNQQGQRKKMLIDWSSIERAKIFTATIESLKDETCSNIVCTQKEQKIKQIFIGENHSKAIKQVAKQQIVFDQSPQNEMTSCNESITSQHITIEQQNKQILIQIVPIDQDILENDLNQIGLVASQQQLQLDINDAQNMQHGEINQGPVDGQPQQQVLCSTADTSNFYPEQINIENLPPIVVVVENEDERQQVAEVITLLSQIIEPSQQKNAIQENKGFPNHDDPKEIQQDQLIQQCHQNIQMQKVPLKEISEIMKQVSLESEPQIFISSPAAAPNSKQRQCEQFGSDQGQQSKKDEVVQNNVGIFKADEENIKTIAESEETRGNHNMGLIDKEYTPLAVSEVAQEKEGGQD